jgi:competence protein ComEC
VILLVPLAFLGAVWGAGANPLPPWAGPPPWWAAGLPCFLGAALLALARRPAHVAGGMALLALALGLLRGTVLVAAPAPTTFGLRLAAGPVVALRGEVAEPPVPLERAQRFRLRVAAVRSREGDWEAVAGEAQVVTRPAPELHAGEALELWGDVAPFGSATPGGYGGSLRRQGVDAVVAFPTIARLGPDRQEHRPWRDDLDRLREALADGLQTLLPEPEASLVAGILLGRQAALPPALKEQLVRSGTSHLVAVSGYNVGLVVVLAASTAGGLSGGWPARRAGAVGASAALWGFVALVGPSGSVLRAAAMAQLALIGRAAGRESSAGALLLWGNALLVAWRPGLVQDSGWQLSILGTAGLIWLAPAIAGRLGGLPAAVREGLGATLAAQVFVLPALATTFGRVSLVAPLANVLALALVGPIMLAGAGTAVTGLLFPPAAPLLAGLAWAPATVLLRVVAGTAALPWAEATIPPWPAPVVAAYVGALVVMSAVLHRTATRQPPVPSREVQGGRPALVTGALLALAAVGCAMVAPSADAASGRTLLLTVPPVPDGALALVRAPDGAIVLVDGGPGTGGAAALLGGYLRPWDRTLDAVFVGDPRDAVVQGLPRVVERYRPAVLLDAGSGQASPGQAAYGDTLAAAGHRGVPRLGLPPGGAARVGRDLRLEVVGMSGSPSRRLAWNDFGILIPGSPATRWTALLAGARPLRSDVLLLEQQTAADPAVAALIRAVGPSLVVVQGAPKDDLVRLAGPGKDAPGGAGTPKPAPLAEPLWYDTSRDGALRLEVRADAYRLNGGPWRVRASPPGNHSGGGR